MSGIFEQDYIMRQIQQLVQVLQQIIFMKSEGMYDEAQAIIDQTLDDFLEDESKDFQSLTLTQTIEVLKMDGVFNAEIAYSVGEILYEKAELEGEYSKSIKFYEQALLLFYKAMHNQSVAVPVTVIDKISHIKEKVNVSSLERIRKFVDDK